MKRPTKGKIQMSSMFRKGLLSTSVLVAVAAAGSVPAFAQDQQDQQEAQEAPAAEGTIVVTGSRIANPNLEQ